MHNGKTHIPVFVTESMVGSQARRVRRDIANYTLMRERELGIETVESA
ncbi:hypothetical protein SALBM135S_09242 [Streptomyces alboniger]